MSEGTIKKKVDRGFGFITTANGTELFFHMSAVTGTTFEALQEGQRVSYTEGAGHKGPRAENVKPM
jgi:cold shock protein